MTLAIVRRSLVVSFAALALALAAPVSAQDKDVFAGTWTLNLAKSKYDPGPAPKSGSVVFASKGTTVTATVDGVAGTGDKMHWSYTAAIDGKDHPMTGNADGDAISLRRISATSIETTYKLKGKPTLVNVRTVSADGKTLTVTTKGANAQGQKVNNTQVFDKK
jgi:hypothetical protein